MLKREARRNARQEGARHFEFECPAHGRVRHYTSSGRCMQCAAEAKDPAAQSAYWATVKEGVNARKRAEYAAKVSP